MTATATATAAAAAAFSLDHVTRASVMTAPMLDMPGMNAPVLGVPGMDKLVMALCGAVAGLGLWVGVGSALGWPVVDRLVVTRSPGRGRRQALAVGTGLRTAMVGAVVVGAGVAVLLRVPVLVVLVAGAVLVAAEALGGPSVTAVNALGAGVAAWCETVRQELDAGQPQRAALIAACDMPPAGLEEPLARLATRLETLPVPEALWAFAAEVRHPAAGHAVAALDVAYRMGAGDLPGLMAGQVETTRHQVQMLRDVHASRAKHRRAMLLLLALFVVVVMGLFVLWPDFLAAYRGVQGQLVLGGIGVAIVFAVRALIRLGQPPLPPDFFTGPRTSAPAHGRADDPAARLEKVEPAAGTAARRRPAGRRSP